MPKPALLRLTERAPDRLVLDMIVDRHPRHRTVGGVMDCPECLGRIEAHMDAIRRAEATGYLKPIGKSR